jgi:Carbohydrate esterase, sialic acid-specific acetylesterase
VSYTPPAGLLGYVIILAAGQSNTIGRNGPIDATLDASDPRIVQFTNGNPATGSLLTASEPLMGLAHDGVYRVLMPGCVGPVMSFCKEYLKGIPTNRKVLILMTAVGGTDLLNGRWMPYDYNDVPIDHPWPINIADLFRNSLNTTLAAAASVALSNVRLGAIVWVQGESDVGKVTANYAASLYTLIAKYRQNFAAANISGASTCPFVL